MSQSAVIQYEAIALQCNAICKVAKKEAKKIDGLIESINKTSSDLLTNRVIAYQKALQKEKTSLLDAIDSLIKRSNKLKEKGRVVTGVGSQEFQRRNEVIELASGLQAKANSLSTNKIQVLEHLINEELLNVGSNIKEKKIKESSGLIEVKESLLKEINLIEDITLRHSTFIVAELKENEGLDFPVLLEKGKAYLKDLTNNVKKENKTKMMKLIKREMEEANVTSEIIKETLNEDSDIDEIRQRATKEIVNEDIRKESLKIILKTIRDRGFIVDTKRNIKIDREKNEVLLVGQKPSGQKAEFKIYLDGRFIYHFDGYEGQACQEDLQPFLEDLENIYGFEMEETAIIWSNPDKIATQKYQRINVRKDKK